MRVALACFVLAACGTAPPNGKRDSSTVSDMYITSDSGVSDLIALDQTGAPDQANGSACSTNSDCAVDEYCAFATQPGCAPPGACKPRPQICSNVCGADVCGCDNMTYCNECIANRAGFNLSANGSCGLP